MAYFDIGKVVCDMHYGLPMQSYYPDRKPLETRSHIQINLENAHLMLDAILISKGINGMITNKMAVVVDYKFDGWCVAAYSYDDRYFGMFEFRIKQNG